MTERSLELRNVGLKVDNKDTKLSEKQIMLLNGVSAKFMAGRVTAVMGASGSGKTTLMSLIAGYVHSNSLACGSILHDGKEREWNTWLANMAYLEQDDCSIAKQTVEEFMLIVIGIRTIKDKKDVSTEREVVNSVMKKLHIDGIKGILMEAISGGERKRVMIAAEMVVGADVLLMDEPTSGLDSHLALDLMMNVRDYVREHNKIVIVTIHQPGPGLFDLFDDLLFMNRGSIVYFGQVDECDNFLKSNGVERKGKLSLSEFLFELFSEDSRIPEIADNRARIHEIAKAAVEKGKESIKGSKMATGTNYKVSLRVEPKKSLLIAWRHMTIEWRTWIFLRSRIVEMLFILLCFGIISYIGFLENMRTSYINYFDAMDLDPEVRFTIGKDNESLYAMNLKQIIEFWKTKIDPSLHRNMVEAYLVENINIMVPILGLIPCSSMLTDLSYITREMRKGAYGVLTLYLSAFIIEAPLILFRCFAICMIYSGIGIAEGITQYFVMRLFATFVFMWISNLMLRCMLSPARNAVLYNFFNLVIHMIMLIASYPINLIFLSENVPYFGYFKYVMYLALLIWPYRFFDSLLEIRYIMKVCNDEILDNKDNTGYKYALSRFLRNPASIVMAHKSFLNHPKVTEEYVMWAYGCAGIVVVIGLSLFFLGRRVIPQMRLKLSK
ncbi:ABC transporter [Ordospora pajunii]|uniref:ABC transporter n=1 Tax=Ordospora pajunii TaxID=3039483 RepID=UPI0029528717|nr:ABC transporter [Ordospora pajunii]KAH9411391.1 ABC transporter [Ordospora pajunii]